MPVQTTIVCKAAQDRYRNALSWLKLWSILLWVFGAAIVIFLVLAIFFFIRQDWLPGALTTLGTIVEGVGINWVVKRRTVAVEEEKEAYKGMQEDCKDMVRAEEIRTSMRM